MSFADRLNKRPPMVLAAVKPTKSMQVSFCLPQVLTLDARPVGLLNLTLAPMLVGGAESTRILTAIEELLSECQARAITGPQAFEELLQAWNSIRQHLDSVSAAVDHAIEEHDATHQHDGGSH